MTEQNARQDYDNYRIRKTRFAAVVAAVYEVKISS